LINALSLLMKKPTTFVAGLLFVNPYNWKITMFYNDF